MRTPTSREENNSCLEAKKTGFAKKKSTAKLILCLEVKKIDFTKRRALQKQICLEGLQHRLHTNESTRNKGKQNSCLEVQKDRLHHRRALRKIYLPQGKKTTTSPTREHPQEGKEEITKTERRAQTL